MCLGLTWAFESRIYISASFHHSQWPSTWTLIDLDLFDFHLNLIGFFWKMWSDLWPHNKQITEICILRSSRALCASLYTIKTGCLHGAKPNTESQWGWCHLSVHTHPQLPFSPALGAGGWSPKLYVCISHLSCVAVSSSNRWLCLFQVHNSWPLSHWPVAAPALAAQPPSSSSLQSRMSFSFKNYIYQSPCMVWVFRTEEGAHKDRFDF